MNSLDDQPEIPVSRKVDRQLYVSNRTGINNIHGESTLRAGSGGTLGNHAGTARRPVGQDADRVVDEIPCPVSRGDDIAFRRIIKISRVTCHSRRRWL